MTITADSKRLRCCVCDRDTDMEGAVFETIGSSGSLREGDGWYLHVHEFRDDGTIPPSQIYGFCPDHLPDAPFPTAGKNPTFDVDVEVERVKDQYGDRNGDPGGEREDADE